MGVAFPPTKRHQSRDFFTYDERDWILVISTQAIPPFFNQAVPFRWNEEEGIAGIVAKGSDGEHEAPLSTTPVHLLLLILPHPPA